MWTRGIRRRCLRLSPVIRNKPIIERRPIAFPLLPGGDLIFQAFKEMDAYKGLILAAPSVSPAP
jgi:hypothetical protein